MNNTIETEYKTENYIIKLSRIPKKYLYSDYKFLCNISVYSILNFSIVNTCCNEIDVIKLLDTLYYSIDNNVSTFTFFNNIDTKGNYNGIKLDLSFDDTRYTYVYSLSILEYNQYSELMTTLVVIHFYGYSEIYQFLDLLYMTFLVQDININDYHIEDNLISDEIYSTIST